jgi:hypothetical protein
MSLEDVDRLLHEQFSFFQGDEPCELREILGSSIRQELLELDGLDRNHPVWSHLAVRTVNRARLSSFLGWKVHHGLAGEATYWTLMVDDFYTGSVVSVEAWGELEKISRAWRYEYALLQGFYNFHRFSAGRWMEEVKGFLVQRHRVEAALDYLRQPGLDDGPCLRWLAPEADPGRLAEYAALLAAAQATFPATPPAKHPDRE